MSDCYLLKFDASKITQSPKDDSFIGGLPKLPVGKEIPMCQLCNAQESFFFQVAFSKGSPWHGFSLAVFACTSCADENHLIPQMLETPLTSADIPKGFLDAYQKNFRFMVFETVASIPFESYKEKVEFKKISLERTNNPDSDGSKVGGNPNWLSGNECPKSYDKRSPITFLLQLGYGFHFKIHKSAPKQIELALDGRPQLSPHDYYELFNGNMIYFFGTEDPTLSLIYAVTQA